MPIYLNSYEPLAMFKECLEAIAKYNIPPFVDRSCRREPDFESQFPMITGLCRGDKLVARLQSKDKVIYRTKKGKYGYPFSHRHIVAILETMMVLPNHEMAAAWYRTRKLPLPNNCMVSDTVPLPETHTMPLHKTRKKFTSIFAWNAHYRKRSIDYPRVVVCIPLFVELYEPPIWTDEMEIETFGRPRGTRNPPQIKQSEYEKILGLTGIKPKKSHIP